MCNHFSTDDIFLKYFSSDFFGFKSVLKTIPDIERQHLFHRAVEDFPSFVVLFPECYT